MNQSINASEIRELSLGELESVSGGFISLPRVYLNVWSDGAWSVGLKGVGGLAFFPETGLNVCGPVSGGQQTCTPIK